MEQPFVCPVEHRQVVFLRSSRWDLAVGAGLKEAEVEAEAVLACWPA